MNKSGEVPRRTIEHEAAGNGVGIMHAYALGHMNQPFAYASVTCRPKVIFTKIAS